MNEIIYVFLVVFSQHGLYKTSTELIRTQVECENAKKYLEAGIETFGGLKLIIEENVDPKTITAYCIPIKKFR